MRIGFFGVQLKICCNNLSIISSKLVIFCYIIKDIAFYPI